MSEKIVLHASRRTQTGKQVNQLRRDGKLPAVIYGKAFDPLAIALNARDASRALRRVTSSTLLTLEIDGMEQLALVRDRQVNRLKDMLMHVDFLAVSMDQSLRVEVPLRLVGVAPAEKTYNAMILQELEELEVEALPQYLPEFIEVDISVLATLGSIIQVGDLKLPAEVEVLTDADAAIAVAISGEAAEAEEAAATADGTEPEVIERGKKEEDEE
jgi:large subunit ribosomal protein L25